MTPEELTQAAREHRAAVAEADRARDARDAAVRKALAAGMTHQAIAEATGLTRGRINQLK